MIHSATNLSRPADGAPDVHPGLRSFLRRRRIVRIVTLVVAALVCITAIAAQLPHSARNDRTRFDHRKFSITEVMAGDLLRIHTEASDETVHLLGVAGPVDGEHWADESRQRMTSWLLNKPVVLLLEPPQTRDAEGNLLAYVYTTDSINVNAEAVREGLAYADRRITPLLGPFIQQAENEARKKSHGLWKDLKDADQPAWRRDWLAAHRRHS
jgi:endonuclease YncB( thermonuclease family)